MTVDQLMQAVEAEHELVMLAYMAMESQAVMLRVLQCAVGKGEVAHPHLIMSRLEDSARCLDDTARRLRAGRKAIGAEHGNND